MNIKKWKIIFPTSSNVQCWLRTFGNNIRICCPPNSKLVRQFRCKFELYFVYAFCQAVNCQVLRVGRFIPILQTYSWWWLKNVDKKSAWTNMLLLPYQQLIWRVHTKNTEWLRRNCERCSGLPGLNSKVTYGRQNAICFIHLAWINRKKLNIINMQRFKIKKDIFSLKHYMLDSKISAHMEIQEEIIIL